MTMPLLVDEPDDRVGHAYSGTPDRLYVIDREVRVAYKGGRGIDRTAMEQFRLVDAVAIKPIDGFLLWLKFSDGTEG